MNKALLERNLWLLKLQKVDMWLFAGSVLVAYQMHTLGLSITQIFTAEAIFAFTIFILQIPTGVFSDLVSRKITLIVAEFAGLASATVFAFAQNYWQIVVSQVLAGIAIATISGTDSSILYDTLKALGREKEHKKILGGITSFFLITLAIGQAIGGLLATIDLRLPMILGIPIILIPLTATFFLEEPPRIKSKTRVTPLFHTGSALKTIFSSRTIAFLILAGIFADLAFKTTFFNLNPFWESIKVPVVYWGILMGSFNIVGAILAHNAHVIIKKFGELKSFLFVYSIWILEFLLLAKLHIGIAFLWPLLGWSMISFGSIFFADEINKRVESNERATVFSFFGLGSQALQMISLPFLGYITQTKGLTTEYLIMAGALVLIGTVSVFGAYYKNHQRSRV